MVETIMKKILYTNKLDSQIIAHEAHMLELYTSSAKKYTPYFEKIGFSLKINLLWKHFPKNNVFFQRGVFCNGYQCYVYCVVQKDGKEAFIESVDEEADYYSLSNAWMISCISRSFCKSYLTLYENVDGIDADLKTFLLQLKHSK